MTLFPRSLLSLAAAILFCATSAIGLRAEGAMTPNVRRGEIEAQIAQVQNEILIAQNYQRPPGEIGNGLEAPMPGDDPYGGQQDSAGLLIRLGRIESQMRQINGQIEQMQFETRRLEEQLKKFQEDVDFRFRDGAQRAPSAPPQKRGEAKEPQFQGESKTPPPAQIAPAPAPRANKRGDAFDPSLDPAAPGVPKPLGSLGAGPAGETAAEGALPGASQNDAGAPLDLSNGRSWTAGGAAASQPAGRAGVSAPGAAKPEVTLYAAPPAGPKGEFDIALAYLKQKAYENAEKGFVGFLEKNPKDKLAPDAIYYLGESYYLRGRRREAAEQYLKVSTHYAKAPRAPQALLRLGQSLSALGAKEQACATFSEVARKYPDAPAMIKTGADREAKRAQC
ncbi:MAG: tol-pal system protein YbgF [Beijerinckiaceae bacterium]|nr:tol-pal system protein YbgF [Beijerinckiaceae bacterium]